MHLFSQTVAFFMLAHAWAASAAAQPAADTLRTAELAEIEVVATTPVPGAALPRRLVPAAVQVLDLDRLGATRALGLPDLLGEAAAGVHLSNLGGNPFQPDVVYRGFRGSPLLGLPQGVVVYQDGARANEPFGDVVHWDLIPETAVARLALVPGSNPLFGLNALGGALVLDTKSGRTHPGAGGTAYAGSFGRYGLEAQAGTPVGNAAGAFVAAEALREEGWRDFSDSESALAFAKVDRHGEWTAFEAGLTLGRNRLRGNGAVPTELLWADRTAVFTHPDETTNTLGLLTLGATHRLAPVLTLSATAYGRLSRSDTFNGDDSDYGPCPAGFDAAGFDDPAGALCLGGEGEEDDRDVRQVFGLDGRPLAFGADVASATQNTTETDQQALGGALQAGLQHDLLGHAHHLVLGASLDGGWADFSSRTELARLTDTRGTVGSGRFDAASVVAVGAATGTLSLFFSDTFEPASGLAVTASGRYALTRVVLDDRRGTALDGDHTFARFNPALGLTFDVSSAVQLYAGSSVSHRAPTPVELTCADPDDPCRLPNGFQADPPLDPAVARTLAGGFRGTVAAGGLGAVRWNLGVFRTHVHDDLYFVSAGPFRNSGYFRNLDATRRQGVEVSLRGEGGPVGWSASYAFLDATFREAFRLSSPAHPEADGGEVSVERGDGLPLVPRHLAKASLDAAVAERLAFGGALVVSSSRYLRGDEANLLDPLGGYAVLDLHGRYHVRSGWAVSVHLTNALGADYVTAGLLGEPDEVEAFEGFEDPRFLTPGAPRAVRLGVEYAL